MIYLMLCIIIIFFLITYFIFKDLFHPAMIICESFLVACLCACYNVNSWGANLQLRTVNIIIIGITSFIIGSIIAEILKRTKKNKFISKYENYNNIKDEFIKINLTMSIILILISGIILIIYTVYWNKAIGGFSDINSLMSQMTKYRYELSFEGTVENSIPTIINQMIKFSKAIAYVFMYIYIHNKVLFNIFKDKNKVNRKELILFIISAIFYLPLTLMSGGRFELFVYVIAYVVMWIIIDSFYKGKRAISMTKIFKIVLLLSISVILFSASRTLVGRTDDSDILSYVTTYFGGGIKGFDEYIKFPVENSDIFGKETFYGINKTLNQIGLLKESYNRHLEFRSINGISLGNVYTSMRGMYNDFGIIGVILLQFILGFIITKFYKKVKKDIGRKINNQLIFYCIIIHSVYFSAYLEFFYNTVLSINYLLFFICLFIVSILINKTHFKTKLQIYSIGNVRGVNVTR